MLYSKGNNDDEKGEKIQAETLGIVLNPPIIIVHEGSGADDNKRSP